jgi:hypothetical protein
MNFCRKLLTKVYFRNKYLLGQIMSDGTLDEMKVGLNPFCLFYLVADLGNQILRSNPSRSGIKKPPFKKDGFFLRRERDSNPRYLAVQRFSRPPHSTTLPSLQSIIVIAFQVCETVCFSLKAVAKLGVLLKSQNLLGKKIRLFFRFCLILLDLRILWLVIFAGYFFQFACHGHSLLNSVGHSDAVSEVSTQ